MEAQLGLLDPESLAQVPGGHHQDHCRRRLLLLRRRSLLRRLPAPIRCAHAALSSLLDPGLLSYVYAMLFGVLFAHNSIHACLFAGPTRRFKRICDLMQGILVSAGRPGGPLTASQVQAQQASGPAPFMCPKRTNSALSTASSSSSLNDDEEGDLMALSCGQRPAGVHQPYAHGYHARSVSTERSFAPEGEPNAHQTRPTTSDRKSGAARAGSVFATPAHHKLSTGDAPTGSALAAPSHMYARASSMRAATTSSSSSSSTRNNTSAANGGVSSGSGSAQIETVYLYGTPTAPRKQLYQRL